jgi:hypothetical protein
VVLFYLFFGSLFAILYKEFEFGFFGDWLSRVGHSISDFEGVGRFDRLWGVFGLP